MSIMMPNVSSLLDTAKLNNLFLNLSDLRLIEADCLQRFFVFGYVFAKHQPLVQKNPLIGTAQGCETGKRMQTRLLNEILQTPLCRIVPANGLHRSEEG